MDPAYSFRKDHVPTWMEVFAGKESISLAEFEEGLQALPFADPWHSPKARRPRPTRRRAVEPCGLYWGGRFVISRHM